MTDDSNASPNRAPADALDEVLDVVDPDDRVIGQATRVAVLRAGLLHRAVNIFVFDSTGRIFLQRRGAAKIFCPLAWDVSAGEHVRGGETYHAAAVRGLREELGILAEPRLIRPQHVQTTTIEANGETLIENELVQLFEVRYDGEIQIDRVEVEDGRFLAIEKIRELVAKPDAAVTPWFLDEWEFLEAAANL